MKKKIFLGLGVVVVVVAGLFAYVISNADSLIASYKPQLEERVSKAIGARVRFESVSLSVFPQTRLRMTGFTVSGESDQDELSLDELVFNAEFFPLLSGKLNINEVSLVRPVVSLIQGPDGIRVAGLPSKERAARGKAESTPRAKLAGKESESDIHVDPGAGLDLSLEKFSVVNASISVLDDNGKLQHAIKNLNIDSSVSVQGQEILLPALRLRGEVKDRGPLTLNLSQVQFNQANGLLNIPTGNLQAMGASLTFQTSYNVNEQSGNFSVEPGSYKLGNESISLLAGASLQQKDFDLQKASIGAFNGTVNFTSTARLDEIISFKTQFSAENLLVERIMDALEVSSDVKVTGPLSASFNMAGQWVDETTLKKTLAGDGSFSLGEGEITGLNLGEKILGSIRDLPFVGGALLEEVPQEFADELNKESTAIKGLNSRFSVKDSVVHLQSLILESDLMDMNANGTYMIDGVMDLRSTVTFSEVLSDALAKKVKELKYALDDQNRLSLPVRLQGTPENLQVTPDTSKLMKSAAGRAIEQGAQKLLDRAFGSKEEKDGEKDGKKEDSLKELGRKLGF